MWTPVGTATAQLPQSEVIRLAVRVVAVDVVYPSSADHGNRLVFFSGEPIRVTVTMRNMTRATVRAREGAGGRWLDSALHTIVRSNRGDAVAATTTVVGTVLGGASRTPAALTLQPGDSEEVVIDVRSDDGSGLPPGDYNVRVQLDPGIFDASDSAKRPAVDTVAETSFRVAAIESRDDEMNFVLHMVALTRLGGDAPAARQWLQRLLALNPESIPGHIQGGEVERAAGDCRAASRYWSRALELISRRADPTFFLHTMPVDAWETNARGLRSRLASCASP